MPAQAWPICAGRAGGPTDWNLRPDPYYFVSGRALGSGFRVVLVLSQKTQH
jgi:hypothetical protein